MIIKRNIINVLDKFKDKLVVLSGPRQTGKTFVINNNFHPDLLLDMDVAPDRLSFKQAPNFFANWYEKTYGAPNGPRKPDSKPLVFIDEIHKIKGWRNLIKGTFDKLSNTMDFVVSGSSAFKIRKQDIGDSLAGRAFWFCLHPVTFREYVATCNPEIKLPAPWQPGKSLIENIRDVINNKKNLRKLWDEYYSFGSYPENLVKRDADFYKQWLIDYTSAMLDRDLKDLNTSKDVERVYQVFHLLMEGLGSTYSLNSIAKTLLTKPDTIKSDVSALKQVLWGWELPVAVLSKAKQIRKEKKFYPIDFCFVDYAKPLMDGAKFETATACLLRRTLCGFREGYESGISFGFYRDYNKKEVDFVVFSKGKLYLAVECKMNMKADVSNLISFAEKFRPDEAVMVVDDEGIFEKRDNHYIVSIELLASVL